MKHRVCVPGRFGRALADNFPRITLDHCRAGGPEFERVFADSVANPQCGLPSWQAARRRARFQCGSCPQHLPKSVRPLHTFGASSLKSRTAIDNLAKIQAPAADFGEARILLYNILSS
jgi:hypothetical protein